jgi:uncharacterized repeat protein (TIGR01451 family)
VLRPRRFLFILVVVAAFCATFWQNARTQSSLRRITNTTEEGISFSPTLSGDGRIVAFESTEDVAHAGGVEGFRGIRANVANDPASFVQLGATRAPAPAVSADGSRIAFASKDNPLGTNHDGNSEIFLYNGAGLLQITNTTPGDISNRATNGNFAPSISANGRFIAFSSNRDLANQNADGNLEIFVYDTVALSFSQQTHSAGIVGFSDPKIAGNNESLIYIRDNGAGPSANRDLLHQNFADAGIRVLAANATALALTYGRAISDDGRRVLWSAQTATNTTQVFLFDGRNNNTVRQLTALGSRATDVPLHPSLSGNGNRVSFATRRAVAGTGSNSDTSVELYTFDIPSGTLGRVTNVNSSSATAEVVSSLNNDGSVIAFNFPRLLSGAVSNSDFANNSEIYLSGTPAPPATGTLTILNRAAMGHEPSSVKAVAPDSIAAALGSALSFATQQAQRQSDGTYPLTVGGTTVTVNGLPAQIFFVSPTEVHFHVPVGVATGAAEVVITNSDGFQSRGNVTVLTAAPGVFTKTADGLGDGMLLNADTLAAGPFDPTGGNLRLLIFATGARNHSSLSVTAGGRALALESIVGSPNLSGLDEIHVRIPDDLRGVGRVELVVRADGRDSNPVGVTFVGDANRDVLINEFLADPPGAVAADLAGDANRDGVRSASQDEFVELVNTTTRDLDISGYRLLTRDTGDETLVHVFAAGTILRSCSAVVVFGGGNGNFNPNDPAFGGALVFKASEGSLSLANAAGAITLQDQAATFVNLVSYGGSSGLDADNNQSVTRSPDITGSFAQHLTAGGGARAFSPGNQLTGLAFSPCTPALARVEVSPSSAAIGAGAQQQFTARAFDSGNNEISGVIFSWQSSNTAVATIDQNGLATGLSPGSTEIRATGRGVVSPPALLTVNPAAPVLTSITISPASATIAANFKMQEFTAQAKDQTGQNIGGVTITFASSDTTVATVEFVSPTSATGSATAQVFSRADGSMQIRASATNGTITVVSPPATLTVEPYAGQLLISEFRTRGPAGAADEFVELYNVTTHTLHIGGLKLRASNGSGTISDRVTVPAATTLGPGCHYLVANGSASGFSGSVAPNQTFGTGITDDGGIAVTGSDGVRIIDAVGMSNGSAFKEGTTLAPLSGSADQSYERKPGGTFGNGMDSDNNAADFVLTTPSNPQNSSSGCLDTSSADLSITKTDSPDPVTIGAEVTYTITITNNGAASAQIVNVTDNLPASVTFVSCSTTGGGVCSGSGNDRRVDFPSLAGGDSAVITLVATANGPVGTTISNTAFVVSALPDSNLANNSATATTLVQAPLPSVSINDISQAETNSGATTFTFTVTSSLPAPAGGITFDVATGDGTAHDDTPSTEDNDYVARSLATQTILAGNTSYTFDVTVNGDTLVEPNETFFVNLANVAGASVADALGQGTIENDDTANLVISQVYAGGGNTGAQFTNDFVEVFNRGTTTVNFAATPYSVQYAGATANFGSSKVDLTSGTLSPGQYFLVQLSSGGANGVPLPAPDATGTIAMAATAGKVALVGGTTALSGSGCPPAATVADFVGYGTTADCFEGAGRAPAPANATADLRKAGGCTDTNENAADFLVTAPFPRNTSSPPNNCAAGLPPSLTINDVTVIEGNSGTTTATFTVSLSAPAPSTDVTFDIATQNNTATTANSDYVARTLTNQLLPAGRQTYTFTVTVNGDTAVENDETFFVNVTNVSGATVADGQGDGTIQNDDLPSLSINDVSLNEGNGSTTTFSFTVGLSAAAPTGGVTFDIATEENTATVADNDYVTRRLLAQTIPAGSSTYTFDVTVNGDLAIEANEAFLVDVTNVSGATVADGQGTGTIQNDDSPTLSLDDIFQVETDSGTTTFTFTVTSSLPAPAGGITFDIATADGAAQDDNPPAEDNDYLARTLTAQTITAGNTTYTFDVTVNGDTLVEPNETFLVNLSNVVGAAVSDAQAQATIQNDDAALVVISQIYGGGNNSGATFQNDFVELFNRGTTTVNFAATPYSVQYASASGSFSSGNTISLTTGTLVPGQYLLISLAGGTTNGAALPPADATAAGINMSATDGKIALVAGTTVLSGSGCPIGPTVADFVGYGSANCFETTATAALSATKAARRTNSCSDANNNSADFTVVTNPPAPRNSSSPLNDCNAPPNLTIDNVMVAEGNSGPVVATFTVSLSAPAPPAGVTFDINTQNDSATTGDNDYVGHSLTAQTITAGNTTYTFAVTVNGDMTVEPDETFFVNVTNVSGAVVVDGQGIGAIQNDDSAPLPNLTIDDVSLSEGNAGATTFTFTVSLSGPAGPGGVSFNIATADGSAQDDTPPSEDNDYVAKSLSAQTITAGNTSYTFDVTVNGDVLVELNETFAVNVSSVTGANVTDGVGQGTIQNDDTPLVVISQVYGGGGNASATYTNDFIEIFNRGTTTIDFSVTPYSVQYAAATSNFTTNKTDITSGVLLPGHYFLVQQASGGAAGVVLPTPDATGTINMSATAGKVALVSGTVALTGSGCPLGATVVDFLGYGTTANCSETAPIAVSGTNANARSVVRTVSCTDTNNNSVDFSNPVTAPVARNTATTPAPCP